MSQEISGNIYQKIIEQRVNILKGFSDYDESQDSPEELEKAEKFDNSTQKTYADNPENRKLNRVGQKYGGRTVKEADNNHEKSDEGENQDNNVESEKQPQEVQPKQTYETEQLKEFASEAEDWQLQEFIKDAKASGDSSEYMQSQIQIAENELKSRQSPSSDIGQGVETDVEDVHNIKQQQSEENGSINWDDNESVKQFLGENPEIRDKWMAMVEEDIFTRPVDLLKIAVAESKSSNEALQTVQEAKQTLDALHAKLGGGENTSEGSVAFKPMEKSDRMGYADAPEDAVISHIGDNDAIYSEKEGYLEIVYEDGNYKQFEGVSSQEEAMKIVEKELASQEGKDVNMGGEVENDKDSSQDSEISNNQNTLLNEVLGDGELYDGAEDFLNFLRDDDIYGNFDNLSDDTILSWYDEAQYNLEGGDEHNYEGNTQGFGSKTEDSMRMGKVGGNNDFKTK